MESVWRKSPPEPGILVKSEIEFDFESDPEYDIMENQIELDNMTEDELKAEVQDIQKTEVQVKSEPEAVIWIKGEPESDVEMKNEQESDNMSKKPVKYYSQDELECIMNTSGALQESEGSYSDSDDGQEDNLECEVLYDSDIDQDYVPKSSDEESDDMSDVDMPRPPAHKKTRRTSTPSKRCAASPPTTHAASTSAAPAAIPPSAPDTPAGVRGRRKTHVRHEEDAPSIVDFERATLSSTSGFRWSCRPQVQSATRTAARNIITPFTPGPTREAMSANTPEKCFSLLFEDQIIAQIVECTNMKIDINAAKHPRRTATYNKTEPEEVCALLGILIFSGCQRDNHLSTTEMWDMNNGPAIYRVAMSQGRFEFLINCLRFDDLYTRQQRQKDDKFAPIRKIWDIFIEKCGKMYMASENITVDEQLLAFRGRCPFRLYIPSKRAKYGMKLVLANDNQSKYLLNAIPYLAKQGTRPKGNINLGHYFTKELTRPYHGTNRNVITDNCFTSVPLVTDLLDNCGMTLVGTVKGNKREIPKEMLDKDNRNPGSSAFLYTKDVTFVSYVPATSKTKKKMVLLLSSMHTQPNLGVTGKPEIIEFYNFTKGGVDSFDEVCAQYSCGRETKRWPLCLFYWMLNASCINSWIIHSENVRRTGGKVLIRRKYMQQLARCLITPWAQKRLGSPNLPRTVCKLICTFCSLPSSAAGAPGTPVAGSHGPLVRCVECPKRSDRKTRHRCHGCRQHVCPRHFYPVCANCLTR